jgi:glycosyltransferase involved in cell wall biosynthesis
LIDFVGSWENESVIEKVPRDKIKTYSEIGSYSPYMRIAILTFHDPIRPTNGSGVRVNNLIKMLKENHKVVVIVRSDVDRVYDNDDVKIIEIKSRFNITYPFNLSYLLKCYRFLRENGCELVIAEEAKNILHAYCLSILLQCSSAYDAHNVDSLNYLHISPLKVHIWIPYFFMELLASMMFKKVLFVSTKDLDLYKKIFRFCKAKLFLVPNGVDCTRFSPSVQSEENTCLFFGSFRYLPNIEALEFIKNLASGLPQINFVIAGEDSDKFAHEYKDHHNIRILGKVDNIVQIIQNSTCVIVPLTKGSGTRLKVLESMACGKPVVTTLKGAEGLHVVNGTEILICSLDSFHENIIRIMSDKKKREMISSYARARVVEEYDWKSIGSHLLQAVDCQPN